MHCIRRRDSDLRQKDRGGITGVDLRLHAKNDAGIIYTSGQNKELQMTNDLVRTPLYEMHLKHGAKMVPFAGFEMPVQYAHGVLKEHLHTRQKAGLFDVSHMGQIILRAKSYIQLAEEFEKLIPMEVKALKEGRQRYGYFTNDSGGIKDDIMFANRGDHIFVVVNAACVERDVAHMRAHMSQNIQVKLLKNRALLALQGPKAENVLAEYHPAVRDMAFMDVETLPIVGAECWVSRSGYTGEDGFEISVPETAVNGLASSLLEHKDVEFIGLGARDSLRLEAGLCLYGHDIDEETSPIEADLVWAIQSSRRVEGGFPGAARIQEEIASGPVKQRVGIMPEGRALVREGCAIYASEFAEEAIGTITSGGFGPTVSAPVSMGYVQTAFAAHDTAVFAEVRGKRLQVRVVNLPFTGPNFKR